MTLSYRETSATMTHSGTKISIAPVSLTSVSVVQTINSAQLTKPSVLVLSNLSLISTTPATITIKDVNLLLALVKPITN